MSQAIRDWKEHRVDRMSTISALILVGAPIFMEVFRLLKLFIADESQSRWNGPNTGLVGRESVGPFAFPRRALTNRTFSDQKNFKVVPSTIIVSVEPD